MDARTRLESTMLCSYCLFVYVFIIIHRIDCFLNVFARSTSIQFKEKCAHSVLLNNNYWLLKQTHQALQAAEYTHSLFDTLPWQRLSRSIEQIRNACLIDHVNYADERIDRHRLTSKASLLLATKTNDIRDSSWMKQSRD
jgi:hypothetical protein